MSKSNNLRDFLLTIANALRIKTGKTGKINPQDFDSEILGIETGIKPAGTVYLNSTEKVNVSSFEYAMVYEPNLTPSNIKLGVNILGVVGTYEAPAPDEPVEPDTPIQKYFTVDGVPYPFNYMTLWSDWVVNSSIYSVVNGYISKDNGITRLIDSRGDEANDNEYILPDEVYTSEAFDDDVWVPFLVNGQSEAVREGTKWGLWGVENGYHIDGNYLYKGNHEYYLCDINGVQVEVEKEIKRGNYVDVLMPDFHISIAGTSYPCRYNMTWYDWVTSEFNTGGYEYISDGEHIAYDWNENQGFGIVVAGEDRTPVNASWEINASENYRHVDVG